jgi:hypothetical protein
MNYFHSQINHFKAKSCLKNQKLKFSSTGVSPMYGVGGALRTDVAGNARPTLLREPMFDWYGKRAQST